MPSSVDDMLRAYIGESSATLKHIADQVNVLDKKFDLHAQEDLSRFRGLESRLDALEREQENTGRHNMAELERKLAEKNEALQKKETEEKERKWIFLKAAAYVLFAAISGGLGFLFHHLVFK